METPGVPATAAAASAVPPPAPTEAAPGAQNLYEAAAADPNVPTIFPKPVTMLVIGMAGSGKTTLMQVPFASGTPTQWLDRGPNHAYVAV